MVGIIIQARMGSTRLPGKVMKVVGDKPLIDFILDRVLQINHSTLLNGISQIRDEIKVIVATTNNKVDDVIYNHCLTREIEVFRGSEENVLERYYLCAKKYGLDHIVRLTADNPLTDIPDLIKLINLHIEKGYEYTYSFEDLPIGTGGEIFTFRAIEGSYINATMPHHFEHVNEYILENLNDFSVGKLKVSENKRHPEIRLTIDTIEDYIRINRLITKIKSADIKLEEVIKVCTEFV